MGKELALYHGTPQADRILAEGFRLDAPRRSDPGDFGWGVYLTPTPGRARCYGPALLRVTVDPVRYARIPSPYFLDGFELVEPRTPAERIYHGLVVDPTTGEMATIRSADRALAARVVRKGMMAAGYLGILTPVEAVVFDLSTILQVEAA